MRIGFYLHSVPFTKGVIDGTESLGGSESACLGLARGLAARGHDVHCLAINLAEDCVGKDAWGVAWHAGESVYDLSHVVVWDVFIALRMPYVFQQPISASLRLLWNQDLLIGEPAKLQLMGIAWALDGLVYVSAYQQKQYEGVLPELKAHGWVCKNGYDPAHVPAKPEKKWNQIIHASRPERGLAPLLAMWPALKARVPEAELVLCRYSSMYDAGGWGKVCESFDREVERVNKEVGGIRYLGELGKPALYQAIAESAVMWYPGVHDFAETSSVIAVEAQANGTPFVGSWKGALPETVPSGILIPGDATTPEYQAQSVEAVAQLLDDCRWKRVRYRELQKAGRGHVVGYTYDAVAQEWETYLEQRFAERGQNRLGVLRAFLHEDDHTAAQMVADAIIDADGPMVANARFYEAESAADLCERVIAGKDQSAEQYGAHALPDPLSEWDQNQRFHEVAPWFKDKTCILDIACGNGSFAIGLAATYPHLKVVGIDYSLANIEKAQEAAVRGGVADRVTFIAGTVYDFDTQDIKDRDWLAGIAEQHGPFDGLFVGEFLEHVANAPLLVDSLEALLVEGALCAYTVPNGPFVELLERGTPLHKGHVHHFTHADLSAMFKEKRDVHAQYYGIGVTHRGSGAAHWLVRYTAQQGRVTHQRPYSERIARQRPKPRLSVGIIAYNAGTDLPRCLASIWALADEIVIGNCGSSDDTKYVAETFEGNGVRKIRVIDLPRVEAHEDGFAGARNAVLAQCTGDWFLWIDADETLVHGTELWKYLETGFYTAYHVKQTHLYLDNAPTADNPARIFRRQPNIQFYGCIHEQPQMNDCNGDIVPALQLMDVCIAHTGYLTERVRQWKMKERNLPLLKRDMVRFPDRQLGKLLVLRDCINLADYYGRMGVEEHRGLIRQYLGEAVVLFEKHFKDDVGSKYYELARPWYERAIRETASAYEYEMALAGRQRGIGPKHAQPERFWARTWADAKRHIDWRVSQIEKQMTPVVVDVEPIHPAPEPSRQREETAA